MTIELLTLLPYSIWCCHAAPERISFNLIAGAVFEFLDFRFFSDMSYTHSRTHIQIIMLICDFSAVRKNCENVHVKSSKRFFFFTLANDNCFLYWEAIVETRVDENVHLWTRHYEFQFQRATSNIITSSEYPRC